MTQKFYDAKERIRCILKWAKGFCQFVNYVEAVDRSTCIVQIGALIIDVFKVHLILVGF